MRRIFRHLISIFADMKMKRKVVVIYLVLGILPMAIISIFAYQNVRDILINSETKLLADTINQAALSINYQVQIFDALSNYLFNDNELLRQLNYTYGDRYFLRWQVFSNNIIPAFLTYKALHPELIRLTIYTGSDLRRFGNYVLHISQLTENNWYGYIERTFQPVWFVTENDSYKRLHTVRRMASHGWEDKINYLYMEFDYGRFFAPLMELSANEYGVAILDSQGVYIFQHGTLSYPLTSPNFGGDLTELQDQFLIVSAEIRNSDWTIYFYTPLAYVAESVTYIILAVFSVFWFALILIGVLAWVFSGIIVHPLEALTKNIQQVQQGELTVKVNSTRNDEVGILIRSFADMIVKIQHLIDVVYKNEIEKKEYQFAVLRAQINPHFLYNSLSLINSKAIVSGEEEISHMALLISSFYRTALNNGNEMTTVENEINNVKSYVSIQQLVRANEFQVFYHLDEKSMDFEIPNFILQPLVENAIDHGLMSCEKTNRCLIVETAIDRELVNLRIADNGTGMKSEQVESLFSSHSTGYGVRNINERLRLLYNDDYCFNVESTFGIGTSIKITIPRTP